MCLLSQQIATPIHEMKTGSDPLVRPVTSVNDCPDKVARITFDYFQVLAKGFKPESAPNIEVRRRVPEWLKVLIEKVFMKNNGSKHSDFPMW